MSEEALPKPDNPTGAKRQQVPPPTRTRSRRWIRRLGLFLIVLSLLLGYFLLIAYLGWRSGQTQLTENRSAQLLAEIEKQMGLAQNDINEARFALAQERLTWILEHSPGNTEAQTLQQQAQMAQAHYLTPQSQPTTSPTPTATPLPTPTPGLITNPDEELERIDALIEAEAWEDTVTALLSFQRQFPSYQRPETDQLLYDAYIALGLEQITGEQVELGMFNLAQARKLGDLPQSVVDYETWAELYLQGISFYGTNWGASAYYFEGLCLAAPFYQDSCTRYHEVLVAYGDQYAGAFDWCPALELYQEAQQYEQTAALAEKRQAAQEGCLAATPTPPPTDTITHTVPITQAQPFIRPSFLPETVTPTP